MWMRAREHRWNPATAAPRGAFLAVVFLTAVMLTGCAVRSPEWAEDLSPCCGQDLIERGIEPPQDRCADIVVDQKTAFRLMKDLTGSAVAHWEVRLIPGGPACIWRIWPGEMSQTPENVQPEWMGGEPAWPDSTGRMEGLETAGPDSTGRMEGLKTAGPDSAAQRDALETAGPDSARQGSAVHAD